MISVEGIDKFRFTCKDGRAGYMNDVLYMSSMKNNLLSLANYWKRDSKCQWSRIPSRSMIRNQG